jgi:general secretion pathway protein G
MAGMGPHSGELRRAGFALIELIIAVAMMAILAAAMVPNIVAQLDRHREEATRAEMAALYRAIVGEPENGVAGYLADMGRLPAGNSLAELISQGSQPAHALQTGAVAVGWSGPYVAGGFQGGDWLRDGWNHDYQFSSTTGQITSAGRDGSFSSADDLVMPAAAIRVTGTLSVMVQADSALVPGNTVVLDGGTARVYAYYSSNGSESSVELEWSGQAFQIPVGQPLPLGLHAVRVVGQDGGSKGDYSGRQVVITAPLYGASSHVAAYLSP